MHQVLIQFELSNLIDEFSAHGITLDRSSKYTIEEQLIHQIKKKIDEEEDKSVLQRDLLHGVVHELRSPLSRMQFPLICRPNKRP